ncbi:peptide ABC transporter substrate-binding protein [Microbacterium testaceum]|uniref:ABC transporter substrate-binding protein n=1 Tax=Microbacterium testaceum TaxID=2033 RepID=UPI000734B0A1|nr:ABC transporter substrate-binding protein [Microbacterium testaceum]KTS89061.1 peptide ABC transporter substrate-binding protein [Microbacterium testaceum]
MKTRHGVIAATLALTVAFATAGCTTTGGDAATASTDTIRTTIDIPATFDPTLATSLPDFLLARTSYDTLVRRDASGLVPGLATKWTSTPTQAVFTIRTDATCSDGTKITPTIVKNSLDYFARPASGSTQVVYTFGPGNTPTITADDAAGTVTVDIANAWPYMVDAMSVASSGIICPAGLADPAGLAAGTVKGSESGPYTLKTFQPGVSYDYTLRGDYSAWPAWTSSVTGSPAANLTYTVSPDSTATANLILGGQLDIGKIQATTRDRFQGQTGYTVTVNPFSDSYLVFNEREGSPFTDEGLRKGVIQAIDRAMFGNVTSQDTGKVLTSLGADSVSCVSGSNIDIPSQDVAAATAALSGKKIRLVAPTIVGPAGAGNEYIAEALRAAGAEVDLSNTDVGSWITTVVAKPGDWDMTVFADLNFLGSLASPLLNLTGPTIDAGGTNYGAVANPAAETSFTAANSAADESARCAALDETVQALVSRSDTLPLLNDAFIYASRPGFTVQMLGGALDDPLFRIAK